jgi:ribonuclease HI
VPLTLRFRSGKGARLCGPFSVHTVVPLTVAQRLAEHIAAHAADGPDVPLFSTGDQAALALLVKEYKNCSLRSLRKGSLVLAANHGVNDDNLMLLSGHQSRATLLRYLGWGRHSASAKQAARRVADALNEPSGAAPWQPEDLTALFKSELYTLSSTLIDNKAVPIPPATPPPTDFDVTIITDACESGWAAWVHESDTGRLREIRSGWKGAMSHSAHAEPEAATMALEWAEINVPHFRAKTVAIVTDHDAIAGRQKRWWSGYSGFSASFYLNRFYNRFYNRDTFASREVFHIQGENNPVDAASRATTIGGRMVLEDIDAVVPVVSQLRHPYRRPPDRKWYQV